MQKRILVPLDGSPLADRVVAQVRRLLVRRDHEVVLLAVVEPVESGGSESVRLEEARAHVEDVRDALIQQGATASCVVAIGDPAEEIVAHAARMEAALVAMATHGRTGLSRFARGSVAEQVIRRSTVPVLVANPRALDARGHDGELRFRRLLVPLDGSETSLAVLPLVEEMALLYQSEVLLLRVVSPVPVGVGDGYPVVMLPSEGEVATELEPARQRLEARGLSVRNLVTFGPDALEILRAADREQVDLVVMSTHGRSGASRWLFGSVAEHVIRHCTRPLLIRRVQVASLQDPGPR